jgi:hypothetical protein
MGCTVQTCCGTLTCCCTGVVEITRARMSMAEAFTANRPDTAATVDKTSNFFMVQTFFSPLEEPLPGIAKNTASSLMIQSGSGAHKFS